MSKFLQLCFVFLAIIAAVVLEASANEAAISDYYYDDYDLYSYDDVVDALYSDQGKEALGSQQEFNKRFHLELFQPRHCFLQKADRGLRRERRGQRVKSDRSSKNLQRKIDR